MIKFKVSQPKKMNSGMKHLFAAVLFSWMLLPATIASASNFEAHWCGCASQAGEGCTCTYDTDLGPSITKEFRAYCTQSDADAIHPNININGMKAGTTCTGQVQDALGLGYTTRSCTNWNPVDGDGIEVEVLCYCSNPNCPPPVADGEDTLTKQQLPIPGGDDSTCLSTAQAGTILSSSLANVDWQIDGNLVVYQSGSPIWSSGTQDNGDRLCFQNDGNLVIYKNGSPTWSSGTVNSGWYLKLANDCNLVIETVYSIYQWGTGARCK